MGYRAIQAMQKMNRERYEIPYPQEPADHRRSPKTGTLERAALTFLRDTCRDLRFDPARTDMNDRDGKSLRPGQIPFNLEKDIDRACLENAVHRFMRSGSISDAFDIYFCYLEMFVGQYATSKKMIEMLAEFETNASSLLMKHRDHYAHSVYVFVLGLAIYNENELFRNAYRSFYELPDETAAAHHFIRFWGLTALFHDIGYPFELSFEQIKSYFGNSIRSVPFVAYKGTGDYTRLSDADAAHFEQITGTALKEPTVEALLALGISRRLGDVYGVSAGELCGRVLCRKPSSPEDFNGFMDHAYFSAVLLCKNLIDVLGASRLGCADLDALTAIALHNSLYKFSITNVKDPAVNRPLTMQLHPLAYLLMLCDELQCWDRIAYGQNSRLELHPMNADLCFEGNRIVATYFYDRRMEERKDRCEGGYRKMTDSRQTFLRDIEDIVALNRPDAPELEVRAVFTEEPHREKGYLSDSNFLHLYYFAVALNGRYNYGSVQADERPALERDFEELSLEYKLSNLAQAKAFARYLDAIGCFYTDKPVGYDLFTRFSAQDMDIIGPLEHARWVEEKRTMGWAFDAAYCDPELLKKWAATPDEQRALSRQLREQTRTHKLILDDYYALDETEQAKDTEPMNCMLRLIAEYDGLRIYRVND